MHYKHYIIKTKKMLVNAKTLLKVLKDLKPNPQVSLCFPNIDLRCDCIQTWKTTILRNFRSSDKFNQFYILKVAIFAMDTMTTLS